MVKNTGILILLCGLVIAGVALTGCTTAEEKAQGNVDETIVLGPGESSKDYYIIVPESSATDFTLASDIPVDIDCPDWPDIDREEITDYKTRIQTAGSMSAGPVGLPLPGSRIKITNPDPANAANVHITLTGVKLYN